MTEDRIAEIRARHEAGAPGEMPIMALARADADRELLLAEVDRLTRERAEARAEVDRLRAALVLASEVLAGHQGSPGREWHSAGAWLYPGDSINVVRAPLPEIEVVP